MDRPSLSAPCRLGSENPFCMAPTQPRADPRLAAAQGTEGSLVCACCTPILSYSLGPLRGSIGCQELVLFVAMALAHGDFGRARDGEAERLCNQGLVLGPWQGRLHLNP